MTIIINKSSRIIIQGITGSVGLSFARRMLEYKSPLAGGVTPGKGGTTVEGCIPVFDSVREAVEKVQADTSLILVPAKFLKEAVLEAVNAGIKNISIYTEGTPMRDVMVFQEYARLHGARVFGPNSAGVFCPQEANLSDLRNDTSNIKQGSIGIISKSGTLTYEIIDIVARQGLGVSSSICLGGDPIVGMDYKRTIELFYDDDMTKAIVMGGELGGYMEIEAAKTIQKGTKPVIVFIGGRNIPPGKRMGHAGAIITKGDDSAEAKCKILAEHGAIVVPMFDSIGDELAKLKAQGLV